MSLQGVKDYAEQQRRLMQDIGTYGQRNRELSRKREEEERQREKMLAEEAESREAEGGGDAEEQGSGKDESAEEPVENDTNAVDNLKQNLHLELVKSGAARELTLESPAFVSESALPLTEPPKEATEATPVADANDEVTLAPEYPLSPVMLSEGKTILTPVPQQPLTVTPSPPESPATCQVSTLSTLQGTPEKSPQTSPNNRRRFVICKVNEQSSKARRLAATADPLGAVQLVDDVIAHPVTPESGDSVTEAGSEDVTNSEHIPDVDTNRPVVTDTDASTKNDTIVSVQGLVGSIVDCVIHDVVGQFDSAQCRSMGESGDTAPCQPVDCAHKPVDTGCGDMSETGDTAANDTDIRTASTQLCENIPAVVTVDSGRVGDDGSGTSDIVLVASTLAAPGDTDQPQSECPVTDHSSTLTPSGNTVATSAECELASSVKDVNELVSSGDSVNELVSSGDSVNELVSSGDSVNELVSSGDRVNELVSSGDSVNELVSSGDSVNELVSSGDSVNGLVSSGDSVNESAVSSGHSETVSSGRGVNELVSSDDSMTESVSSCQGDNVTVSPGKSVSASVSSGISVNGSVSSGVSVNESVSSGVSVNEPVFSEYDQFMCAGSGVKELPSPRPAGCQLCVADTGDRTDTCSTQADECHVETVMSPKSDQCHTNDVLPKSLQPDQCHSDDVVSPESLNSDKCHEIVSLKSHQSHTGEVVPSESPKLDQCHAEPYLLNCVAESATSERRSGPAASPDDVTVSLSEDLCHQTEPNLRSSLSMNGMRVELASVLDSLDQQLDPLTTDQG